MLRRRGDKEFPSLESENVRASRVLGGSVGLISLGDRWETEAQSRRETAQSHRAYLGRAATKTQAEVQTKFRKYPQFSWILYTAEREREKDLFLWGCSNLEKIAIFFSAWLT